jgi:N-acetylmuramoyl-L-alanine amidase
MLVGVLNNSGARAYGISLVGFPIPFEQTSVVSTCGIFDFVGANCIAPGTGYGGGICDHDPACTWPHPTGFEGPKTSFQASDSSHGVVNFFDDPAREEGLADQETRWFTLKGRPVQLTIAGLFGSVTLDPGHGQINCPAGRTGTTGPTGLTEWILTWAVATRLQADLNNNGYRATLTKPSDLACPDYAERAAIANRSHSNMFVSIHFDGIENAPAVNGARTYFRRGQTTGQQLSGFITPLVSSFLGVANNNSAPAVFNVLVLSRVTAVLAEVATITNAHDEFVMAQPAAPQLTSNAIGAGIVQFVNQPNP